MQALIADVLATWRQGERLLDELPPTSADHETVALAVARLKVLYGELTGGVIPDTQASLQSSRDTIENARELLSRARR